MSPTTKKGTGAGAKKTTARKPAPKKAKKRAARKATKRTAKKTAGSRAATVTFAARHMKKKPDITMTELKKLARGTGHNIYPLIIGLARKELGLKPSGRRTSGAAKKAGRKKAARGKVVRKKPARKVGRRPGRGRRGPSPVDAVAAIAQRIRDLEREAIRLRKALDRIGDIASRR